MTTMSLSSSADKLKEHIQKSFDKIRQAVDCREKLLLRQVTVLQQTQPKLSEEVKFLPDNEDTLLSSVRMYGKFNMNLLLFPLTQTEDYICPNNDHDVMYKNLEEVMSSPSLDSVKGPVLVDKNMNTINDSIINMILNESKELIEKSKLIKFHKKRIEATTSDHASMGPLKLGRHGNTVLDLDVLNNNLNKKKSSNSSSHGNTFLSRDTKLSSAKTNSKSSNEKDKKHKLSMEDGHSPATKADVPKKRFASALKKNISNMTINHCYAGTLTLKNITNLTINSHATADRPPTTMVAGPRLNRAIEEDTHYAECDFYHRLINDNKLLQPNYHAERNNYSNNIKPTVHLSTDNEDSKSVTTESASTMYRENFVMNSGSKLEHKDAGDGLNSTSPEGDNGGGGERVEVQPIQIQQWLKQICYETETEPMQNIDILEFSRISGSCT